MKIQEYLEQHNLITDGAFGTYYGEKYGTREMPEQANLRYPERVQEIHEEYLEAGAKLIRTNTFAANTVSLQESWENVENIIRNAIAIAQKAVESQGKKDSAYIAGDIGPIAGDGPLDLEEISQEYYKIAKVFVDAGIHILDFETHQDLDSILPAIRRIKEEQDVFVMVSFSVNQFGYSAAGLSAKRLLEEALEASAIDAVGFNCGMGPSHMYRIFQELKRPKHVYLMALPNAGYATLSRNQLKFGSAPMYYAEKMAQLAALGIPIVGGCCGTNPKYIRSMSQMESITGKKVLPETKETEGAETKKVRCGFLYDENGERKNKKLIAVELAPPFNTDDEKLLESANLLKKANVDVLTFPDSPSGRTRVDSVLMAEKVRRVTGMEVMPHICCRDKNGLAIRSLLMGAQINDIHNLLLITGDPLPSMVRQSVKAVFNFDSVGLMKIAEELNEDAFGKYPLCYGGAINQGRRNLDVEIGRVQKKMDAGAEFFLTQPIFTQEDVVRLKEIKAKTGACIFCGIMPLVSRKNALFMKNEIAGVNVTEEIVNRYPENGTREQGEAVGVALAKEIMAMVGDFADGYYFSFPFNRVYLLAQILEPDGSDRRN